MARLIFDNLTIEQAATIEAWFLSIGESQLMTYCEELDIDTPEFFAVRVSKD